MIPVVPPEVVASIAAEASQMPRLEHMIVPAVPALPRRPVTPQCIVAEAGKQGVGVEQLLAIMKEEAGRVGGAAPATNNTYDLGPMGINSVHIEDISKVMGLSKGQVTYLLVHDGCFNVAVAAWQLRIRTNEVRSSDRSEVYWGGIGRYHSRTPELATAYMLRVHKRMMQLLATGGRNE